MVYSCGVSASIKIHLSVVCRHAANFSAFREVRETDREEGRGRSLVLAVLHNTTANDEAAGSTAHAALWALLWALLRALRAASGGLARRRGRARSWARGRLRGRRR